MNQLKSRKDASKARNEKIIGIILISLLFISVGYATLKTTLGIEGEISFSDKQLFVKILGQTMIAYRDNEESPYVANSSGINFAYPSSNLNGKGLYLKSETKDDENPVYYFRGNVTNNNVLFGGSCWKIVRTTEQGGVKLIYNGKPKDIYSNAPLEKTDYVDFKNDSNHPYTYDAEAKRWSSIVPSTYNCSYIEFKVKEKGRYVLDFKANEDGNSSYYGGISVAVDIPNHRLGNLDDQNVIKVNSVVTGDDIYQVDLGYLYTNNTIRIWYSPNSSCIVDISPSQSISMSKSHELWISEQSSQDESRSVASYESGIAKPVTSDKDEPIIDPAPLPDVDDLSYEEEIATYADDRNNELGITFSVGKKDVKTGDSCDNFGTDTMLPPIKEYNSEDTAISDVGYMYGTRYEPINWEDTNYIYGSDVSYSNGKYTLESATTSPDKINNVKNKHYTCKSNATTCEKVYYVYSSTSVTAYAIELTGGKKLENILSDSYVSDNSSKVKSLIDLWYTNYLSEQESKLEDAVWCNDRSIASGGYLEKGDATKITYFGAHDTRKLWNSSLTPALKDSDACINKIDRYTVSDTEIGNGALDYPIGLLTADEAIVAGNINSSTTYLTNGYDYWLLTPYQNLDKSVHVTKIDPNGNVKVSSVSTKLYVRPSIVLNKDMVATSGDGTGKNPYVVE